MDWDWEIIAVFRWYGKKRYYVLILRSYHAQWRSVGCQHPGQKKYCTLIQVDFFVALLESFLPIYNFYPQAHIVFWENADIFITKHQYFEINNLLLIWIIILKSILKFSVDSIIRLQNLSWLIVDLRYILICANFRHEIFPLIRGNPIF